ncbi:NADH dehydrogenase [ubiquinone] 1 beta subcomplex subunit 2, mitochondrial-like [Polistes fuscatus]|uniref:NADH dehydrogenase [ubiquinone] 1 beta subcomplex subunit 2, mitochondrial-like n=1 Tax=Polistes fuscatus TaxID=30207 RepID=UPI001CA88E58|nr:NADH dehydrogenase [ubiquinone] 1 beta subcomplex subunit 2, mitochondrial-like [Polistes fuscatus]
MLISRGVNVLKHISKHVKRKNTLINNQPVRSSHAEWGYREDTTNEKSKKYYLRAAEICGGIAWWWFLYRMWHDHLHLVGHFDYPDPSKWTDEELGIPPDDYD